MCMKCGRNCGAGEYVIIHAEGFFNMCANCLVSELMSGSLKLPATVNDITGEDGDIVIGLWNDKFTLSRSAAYRFLNHSLHPSEYRSLVANKGYDYKTYMPFDLHDDFYSEGGHAYQPYMSNHALDTMYGLNKTKKEVA